MPSAGCGAETSGEQLTCEDQRAVLKDVNTMWAQLEAFVALLTVRQSCASLRCNAIYDSTTVLWVY